MPNHVAEAAHLLLVGGVTKMKMLNIGGGHCSIGSHDAPCNAQKKAWTVNIGNMSNIGNNWVIITCSI